MTKEDPAGAGSSLSAGGGAGALAPAGDVT
jgi:hypothetical protein